MRPWVESDGQFRLDVPSGAERLVDADGTHVSGRARANANPPSNAAEMLAATRATLEKADVCNMAVTLLSNQLSPLRSAKAALDAGQLTVAQLNQVAKALVKAAIVVVRVLLWRTQDAIPAAQPGDNGT